MKKRHKQRAIISKVCTLYSCIVWEIFLTDRVSPASLMTPKGAVEILEKGAE